MLESKGTKRTLASLFAVLAAIAPGVSILAPYAEILVQVAGALGGLGVAHAGVKKIKG